MQISRSFTMSGTQENRLRMTRARAESKQPSDQNKIARKAPKRASADENDCSGSNPRSKRRAVLRDVSNLCVQANDNAEFVPKPKPQGAGENSNGSKGRGRGRKKAAGALAVNINAQDGNPLQNAVRDGDHRPEAHTGLADSKPAGDPPVVVLPDQRPLPIPDDHSQARQSESSGVECCSGHIDMDSGNADPQMCGTYAADIYGHLRIAELKKRPLASYMETVQHDVTPHMRGILIDWLVEVAEEYKLVPDTLYLTVAYIDRFLSSNPVNRQKLQLLGISCMLIASKYEEISAPQVDEFCYITDNTYNREEVLAMERKILNFLHFEMTIPTTKTFLRRFIRAAQAGNKAPTLQMEFLGNYLAELTLVDCNFLQYLPSLIAASAVFLARLTLANATHPWDSTLQHYTGYQPSTLKDCVCAIYDLQLNRKGCTLNGIREKYRQHKFKCVANLLPPPAIPHQFFEDIGK